MSQQQPINQEVKGDRHADHTYERLNFDIDSCCGRKVSFGLYAGIQMVLSVQSVYLLLKVISGEIVSEEISRLLWRQSHTTAHLVEPKTFLSQSVESYQCPSLRPSLLGHAQNTCPGILNRCLS